MSDPAEDPSNDSLDDRHVLCYAFDSYSHNILIGTKRGIHFIDYSNPAELKRVKKLLMTTYMIEKIPDREMVIYVPDRIKKRLIYHHYGEERMIIMKNITEEIRYNAPIVRIKVTRDRVIVALQNALHLYHGFANHFVPIRRIDLTAKISGSVVDLSIHPVNKCIAYPNTNRVGHLIVADCIETDKTKYIPAHDSKLAAVAIDPNGRTVASASESGALIKVHRTFNGELVYEFKRGVTLYAKMLSLGFSNNARYLWTHESTGFLKFYKIGFRASVAANGASWFLEKFQRIAQSILPGNASNWLFQEDNFAYGEQVLGSSPEAAGHIFKNDGNQIPPHLILVSIDGYVYSYEINTVEGGSCEIICCYDIERKTICETPQILNWDELR